MHLAADGLDSLRHGSIVLEELLNLLLIERNDLRLVGRCPVVPGALALVNAQARGVLRLHLREFVVEEL